MKMEICGWCRCQDRYGKAIVFVKTKKNEWFLCESCFALDMFKHARVVWRAAVEKLPMGVPVQFGNPFK